MSKFLCGIIGALLAIVGGCSLLEIDKLGIDDDSQLWRKAGADNVEVRKALLECGAPNPQGYTGTFARGQRGANDSNVWIKAYFCMENSGFHLNTGTFGYESVRKFWCGAGKMYPACRLGAEIPVRSVQRRLNSDFCHQFKKAPSCQS